MRLLIILMCFISYVVSRPQNSENNGYQYNLENQSKNIDRLANLGLTQKLLSTQNLQNVANKNYLPPSTGRNNLNILPLPNGNLEITKSIGITSPQGDDNGFLQENKNILEQSGLLNGIHNNANYVVSGADNNIPKFNIGSPTQSDISFSIDNNYNPVSQQQQQLNPVQPQYSPSYQNYAPNYNSNGILSQQRDDVLEKNIYVHLPSSVEQYQQPQQPPLPPRKHYKIIFVKAPNRPTPPPQPIQEVEEKTLVYVLVQKPNLPTAEEIQAVQQQSTKSSKPEVYFIKYKTGQTEPGKIQSSLESELPQGLDNNGGSLIKNSINSGLTLTSTSINDGSHQNQRFNDNRPQHLYDAPK